MQQPAIRRAGPGDAARLAEIGARTFEETFGRLYPPEDLADFLAQEHSPAAAARALADPAQAVWLALADGAVVGYAHAGPCTLPLPGLAGCGEVKRLYLLKRYQGGGLGERLIRTAMAWLEARHPGADICLGVWSENFGAQRFYSRFGFEPAGEYLFPVGDSRDLEFVYRRSAAHENSP